VTGIPASRPVVATTGEWGLVLRALALLDATDGATLAGTVALIGEARRTLREARDSACQRRYGNPQREGEAA
jgi:hypothetical protein